MSCATIYEHTVVSQDGKRLQGLPRLLPQTFKRNSTPALGLLQRSQGYITLAHSEEWQRSRPEAFLSPASSGNKRTKDSVVAEQPALELPRARSFHDEGI